jgi:hypothetical protein
MTFEFSEKEVKCLEALDLTKVVEQLEKEPSYKKLITGVFIYRILLADFSDWVNWDHGKEAFCWEEYKRFITFIVLKCSETLGGEKELALSSVEEVTQYLEGQVPPLDWNLCDMSVPSQYVLFRIAMRARYELSGLERESMEFLYSQGVKYYQRVMGYIRARLDETLDFEEFDRKNKPLTVISSYDDDDDDDE